MKLLKIPLTLLILPVLLVLRTALIILDRISSFFTGLLTMILFGFLVHHWAQESWDNVILLNLSLIVCIGVPATLHGLSTLLQRLTAAIIS